ncbi:MAG: dynamin family protein [Gemmatimonadota bacterium]|nr:dynamin family protein [Gemmatimonadota bacterium]
MPLNASQRRNVSATFSYVDGLLRKIERVAAGEPSPFAAERPDLGPAEVRLLDAVVRSVRDRMLLALDRLGIPRPRAALSARWSVETTLNFADIAVSELNETTLRGYGALDPSDGAEVAAVGADLRRALSRGRDLFRGGTGVDLTERLQGVRGEVGEILRALERLSTEHGLVEIRPGIAAAAERAAANTLDVGVFGRVSSGKSSLINALVTRPILPVGATPVTAVPVRIRQGPDGVAITFADGRRETTTLDALADFATEERNPDNARDVAAVDVTVPEMMPGMLLLDTPGVGSLALGGAARAYAWLPRCDLGVVLVAAGTPLGKDELALVAALRGAGIAAQAMLSKADLLSAAERADALAYLQRDLAHATHEAAIPVWATSARDDGAGLLDAWRQQVLVPLVAARRVAAARALGLRLDALVHAAAAAYSGRIAAVDDHAVRREQARAGARRRIIEIADRLEADIGPVLDGAARAAVDAWKLGRDGRHAAQLALQDPAWEALEAIRREADLGLGGAADNGRSARPLGDAGSRLPPVFDPQVLGELPMDGRPGALGRWLGWRRARQHLNRVAQPLAEAYRRYGSRLREWGLARLSETVDRELTAAEDGADAPLPPEFAALLERVRALELGHEQSGT